jgi:cytochrome b561
MIAMWRGDQQQYGMIAKSLHWLIALLIFAQAGLGFYMSDLDYYDPLYKRAFDLHKSTGVLTFVLIILRLLWAWVDVRPPLAASMKSWEKLAASSVHQLLYLLMVLIPLAGYLVSTADGRAVDVFGLFELPALLPAEKGREEWAGDLHEGLAVFLLLLVVGHVMAALRHHFINKDSTLRKML